MKRRFCRVLLLLTIPLLLTGQVDQDETKGETESSSQKTLLDVDFQDAPTFIKSNSLTLKAEARIFEYKGNVEVKQGDFILNCDFLEGFYSENNEVQKMIAHDNVVITKGQNIRATSELAEYLAADETVTLTLGPELQQDDSVLTADAIKIFLKEDRSVAEGAVRVKLVENQAEGEDTASKPNKKNLF